MNQNVRNIFVEMRIKNTGPGCRSCPSLSSSAPPAPISPSSCSASTQRPCPSPSDPLDPPRRAPCATRRAAPSPGHVTPDDRFAGEPYPARTRTRVLLVGGRKGEGGGRGERGGGGDEGEGRGSREAKARSEGGRCIIYPSCVCTCVCVCVCLWV
jgi:hypothetical protein